jgi:hypothetical protein
MFNNLSYLRCANLNRIKFDRKRKWRKKDLHLLLILLVVTVLAVIFKFLLPYTLLYNAKFSISNTHILFAFKMPPRRILAYGIL